MLSLRVFWRRSSRTLLSFFASLHLLFLYFQDLVDFTLVFFLSAGPVKEGSQRVCRLLCSNLLFWIQKGKKMNCFSSKNPFFSCFHWFPAGRDDLKHGASIFLFLASIEIVFSPPLLLSLLLTSILSSLYHSFLLAWTLNWSDLGGGFALKLSRSNNSNNSRSKQKRRKEWHGERKGKSI